MGPFSITLLILLAIVVLAILYAVSAYNNLVTLRNQFKNAFSQGEAMGSGLDNLMSDVIL